MTTMNGSVGGKFPPDKNVSEFREEDIAINVDLIAAAKNQLTFLKEVDKFPCLYSGYVVKNAILRYEKYWLPLAAEYEGRDLAPPLDVHWVWHCHMLAPYYYEKDCRAIVGKVIPHTAQTENGRRAAMEAAHHLWMKKYNNEPFHLRLDEYCNTTGMSNGFHKTHDSKITYNLEAAIERQRMFYYQVSLPHFRDTKFLQNAVLRYKKYLFLKKQNIDLFLVPCYDFDLVWHAHQVHPVIYKEDTEKILGRMFNHDDSVNDRSPNSKLNKSDTNTRELWKKFFNEDFALCGAMFRGEPPHGKLVSMSEDNLMSVCSIEVDVTLHGVHVEDLPADEFKYSLEVSIVGKQAGPTLLKLKGPSRRWKDHWKGVANFTFDTRIHTGLQFSLFEKKGFMCCSSNQPFGEAQFHFLSAVNNTPGQSVKHTLPLMEASSGHSRSLSVDFSLSVPRQGN